MATPAAAGVAALIIQFFQDANFWKSLCITTYKFCKTFTPSGVLIKAIMLHSAVGMKMIESSTGTSNINLGTPPDSMQVNYHNL